MATPAAQFAIPAPHSASFTNDEVAVGALAAAAGTYRFSRWFYAEKSTLALFKAWFSGAATVRVGANAASLTQVLSAAGNTVIQVPMQVPAGLHRIEITVTHTSGNAGFAFLLSHPTDAIYVSENAGWVYSTAGTVPDGEMAALIEKQLPVFTTLPNWGESVTETITYLTDILTSETGAEQPRSLRRHPRRMFEASFQRHGTGRSRLDSFLTGIGRRMFWMPLWHEQFRPTGGVSGTTVQFPSGTLKYREFDVGDKVFVNAGDPDTWEVLTVNGLNYDTDVLTWKTAPTGTWPSGTRIIPMRRARVTEQGQLEAPVDRVGKSRIRFDLVDPEYRFGASWGRSSPLWWFKIDRKESLQFDFDHVDYRLDNDQGWVSYSDPGKRSLVTMRSSVLSRGRKMLVDLRRFYDMAEGRAGRFWMPTLMQDIVPTTSTISGSTLNAKPFGYIDYIESFTWARAVIGITFNDGSPALYRYISDATRVSGSERFTLTETLPPINVSTIDRIQFMVPSRFDQDSFEFEHYVDDAAAVRTKIVTRSVDGDDLSL